MAFTAIPNSIIDADSPLDATLFTYLRDNDDYLNSRIDWSGNTKFDATTGHKHTGAANDAPMLSISDDSLKPQHIDTDAYGYFEDFNVLHHSGSYPLWSIEVSGGGLYALDATKRFGVLDTWLTEGTGVDVVDLTSSYARLGPLSYTLTMEFYYSEDTVGLAAGQFKYIYLMASGSIYFGLSLDQDGNWYARCRNGGALTSTSLFPRSTSWKKIKFIATTSDIKVYVDGTLTATLTTNLPSSGNNFYVSIRNDSSSAPPGVTHLFIDWIKWWQDGNRTQ